MGFPGEPGRDGLRGPPGISAAKGNFPPKLMFHCTERHFQ